MPRADSPYNNDWKRIRVAVLKASPNCRLCGRRASMVDHITPVRDAPHRRLDPANLQALCFKCHVRVTNSFDRNLIPRGACDEAGRPLDPKHPWAQDAMGHRSDSKRAFIRRVVDGKWGRRRP